LEHQILELLAASNEPMTAAEVREALDTSLAYNTVLTVMTRLSEKGMVTKESAGRAFAFRAVTDPAAVTAWRMRQLLEGDEDRAAVLTRFHDALSPQDVALLAELISNDDEPDPS
jgi:predicted transcriptional regulator